MATASLVDPLDVSGAAERRHRKAWGVNPRNCAARAASRALEGRRTRHAKFVDYICPVRDGVDAAAVAFPSLERYVLLGDGDLVGEGCQGAVVAGRLMGGIMQ
jgi:hypothetical protein